MSASPPQHRSATLIAEQATIRTLDLPDLLPAEHRLALQDELGLAALVALDPQRRPVLSVVQLFTASEWALLGALLSQYPDFCPYEVLLAHFHYYSAVTEQKIERMREQLSEAQEEGTWDVLMRPARNVLSRVRIKLRSFGVAIVPLLETGYLLQPSKDTWHGAGHRDRKAHG
jgi:hypothetical protein